MTLAATPALAPAAIDRYLPAAPKLRQAGCTSVFKNTYFTFFHISKSKTFYGFLK